MTEQNWLGNDDIDPEVPFEHFKPRWVLSEGSWTLPGDPDDLVDPEPLPPWAIRQEKPENDD